MPIDLNELTIPDVFDDITKNLCSIFSRSEESDEVTNLVDSLYYTENDFKDHIKSKNIQNVSNLTIISINIANLFSKLRFFKVFLNNITTSENQPDIIVVTETHISESTNTGYSKEELRKIIPGYNFYHVGRETKKGGGVGVFVSQKLKCET